MKHFIKILYYLRMILFPITLILLFITMKTYIKVGLWGYLFFVVEFVYIFMMILTFLAKNNQFKNDVSFNIMHIGTYIYQIIVAVRTFNFRISSLLLDSYLFYRNNCIIMFILLITLIIYTAILYSELNIKKKKSSQN